MKKRPKGLKYKDWKCSHSLKCQRCGKQFAAKLVRAKWCSESCKQAGRDSRKWHLKYMYGITQEQYDNLHTAQNGKCAICQEITKLFVDHCHTSGEIRGLLCSYCNTAIGMFRDEPETMVKAIDYINRSFKRTRTGRVA